MIVSYISHNQLTNMDIYYTCGKNILTDVRIKLADGYIDSHKIILYRNEWFRTRFETNVGTNLDSEIDLTNINKSSMEFILKFYYDGDQKLDIDLPVEDYLDIIYSAKFLFAFDMIKHICFYYWIANHTLIVKLDHTLDIDFFNFLVENKSGIEINPKEISKKYINTFEQVYPFRGSYDSIIYKIVNNYNITNEEEVSNVKYLLDHADKFFGYYDEFNEIPLDNFFSKVIDMYFLQKSTPYMEYFLNSLFTCEYTYYRNGHRIRFNHNLYYTEKDVYTILSFYPLKMYKSFAYEQNSFTDKPYDEYIIMDKKYNDIFDIDIKLREDIKLSCNAFLEYAHLMEILEINKVYQLKEIELYNIYNVKCKYIGRCSIFSKRVSKIIIHAPVDRIK